MTKLLITLHFAKVMSSIKETRNLLLVSCVTGIINANEFAILYNVNMSKNPLFLYDNYEEFSLDNFSKEKCIVLTTGIYWPITSTDQIYISTAMGAKFLGATFVDTWDELTCLPLAKNWQQNWQRVFGRTTSEYANLWTIPRCGPITWAKWETWQIIEPG